eukprot:9486523-Pyramimonas_sp.AAC.1
MSRGRDCHSSFFAVLLKEVVRTTCVGHAAGRGCPACAAPFEAATCFPNCRRLSVAAFWGDSRFRS